MLPHFTLVVVIPFFFLFFVRIEIANMSMVEIEMCILACAHFRLIVFTFYTTAAPTTDNSFNSNGFSRRDFKLGD